LGVRGSGKPSHPANPVVSVIIRQRASLLWLRDLSLTAAQRCNLQEAGVCFP